MILTAIGYLIIGLYTIALVYVTLYCLSQFHLLLKYWQNRKRDKLHDQVVFATGADLPRVTIQLPVFNERYVIDRLIDNIVLLDYPRDKMEIQVLDDSTDDTREVCRAKVE